MSDVEPANEPRSSQRTVTVDLGPRSYPIEIEAGSLERIGRRLAELTPSRRAAVFTDANVGRLYAGNLEAGMRASGFRTRVITLPDGERTKSIANLARAWSSLAQAGIERRDTVVALGGGVIGDLAGFAASTFRRGIPLLQVPTSLIAQVDSAIGGKTGINLDEGKNLAGTFHQPIAVLVDPALLATLPDAEYRSGLAEVVKYGIIRHAGLFERLEREADRVVARAPDAVAHFVHESARAKAVVVSEDETEASDVRRLLNLGHTLGHALEAVAGYGKLRHGEAVAIGTVCAGRLARRRGLLSAEDARRIQALLERLGLPTSVPPEIEPERVRERLYQDKKRVDDRVLFVLPTGIGSAKVEGVADDEILDALGE